MKSISRGWVLSAVLAVTKLAAGEAIKTVACPPAKEWRTVNPVPPVPILNIVPRLLAPP